MTDQNNTMDLDFSTEGMEQQKDTLRRGDFNSDTGLYEFEIKMARIFKSKGGATGVAVQYLLDNGKTVNDTQYVTTKEGKPYSQRQGSDKKNPLPGFTLINELCLATTGNGFKSVYANRETKKVNLWDSTKRQEVPTDAEVLVDLIGQKGIVGLHKIEKNKQEESPKGSGNWVDTNDKRVVNEINKVFTEGRKTTNEVLAEQPATFIDLWAAEYGTATINQFKEVANAPKSGSPGADRTGGTNDDSIFGE